MSSSLAKKIKLGFITGLSGPYAREAKNQLLGARLAVDEANNNGGLLGYQVKLLVADDQLWADMARKKAIELINSRRVDLLAGSVSAATQISINEEAKKHRLPFMSVSQSDEITTSAHLGPYTFHEALTPHMTAQSISRWVLDHLSNSWFLMAADYTWGHQNLVSYLKFAKENNVRVRGVIKFPLGSNLFTPYFSKIIHSKAEVLILTGWGNDQLNFVQQATKAGLKKELSIVLTISELTMAQKMDPRAAAGMYWGTNFYWGLAQQIPSAKKFVSAFQRAFGVLPTGYAGYAYSGVKELLWAVEQSADYPIQPDKLTRCLEARSYSHYKKEQWWRPCDHQSFQNFYILKFKGPEERKNLYDVAEVLGLVSWDMGIERTCKELGHMSHLWGHGQATDPKRL